MPVKITAENFNEQVDPVRQILINYKRVNEAVVKFQNNSNHNTFKFIFSDMYGEEVAERLFQSFKLKCDSKVDRFNTYLTNEQQSVLLANIYLNQEDLYWR